MLASAKKKTKKKRLQFDHKLKSCSEILINYLKIKYKCNYFNDSIVKKTKQKTEVPWVISTGLYRLGIIQVKACILHGGLVSGYLAFDIYFIWSESGKPQDFEACL